ncbi:hypothetical protein SAMN05444161_0002 [Rhizobiales bacterium GAS191]|nr:hypothetical protein SAMN05444161_0002 [Rhizobiales bacterium GAS191]
MSAFTDKLGSYLDSVEYDIQQVRKMIANAWRWELLDLALRPQGFDREDCFRMFGRDEERPSRCNKTPIDVLRSLGKEFGFKPVVEGGPNGRRRYRLVEDATAYEVWLAAQKPELEIA